VGQSWDLKEWQLIRGFLGNSLKYMYIFVNIRQCYKLIPCFGSGFDFRRRTFLGWRS
jgi:hypothetical protein